MTPKEIQETMWKQDRFSQWLGLQVEEVREGYCRLHYRVTEDMMNGFNSIHGGILFSAADSAFAFACNSHGIISVALNVSIAFTGPAVVGETMLVEAREVHLGNRTGLYEISTINEQGKLVAQFTGTAYRTGKSFE